MTKLICSACRKYKKMECFYRRTGRKRGFHYRCKKCELTAAKTPHRRKLANKATDRFRKKLKENDPEEYSRRIKNSNLKKKLGIGVEDYDRMFLQQGGKCKICGRSFKKERHGSLSVDHCHKTGKIRGLLCAGCNVGLGGFRDNPKNLKRAIMYLSGTVTVPIS